MSTETLVKCLKRPERSHTTEYLSEIRTAILPRRSEVLLEFLLRSTKDAQDTADLACLWESMAGIISCMPQVNLISILKKSSFMASLENSLSQIHRSPKTLKHISEAFHILLRSRRVTKAISCSLNLSISILESLMRQEHSLEGLGLLMDDVVNFVLRNTAQKQTRRKFIESIKDNHLKIFCAYITSSEKAISRLIRCTFFPEQLLLENASNPSADVLKSILSDFSSDTVNEQVIGLSYHAISHSKLSSEKQLASLNQMLTYWLQTVSAGLFLSTLQQYGAHLPTGHRIRVLSHPDNRVDLSRILDHCFATKNSHSTLILITILEIDLDVLIPSATDLLLTICGSRPDTSIDDEAASINTIESLEVAVFHSYTVLRSSEAFIGSFAALLKTNRGTNVKLFEAVAATSGSAHDSVKDRMISSLLPLATDTSTRASELLLAVVSGCPLHCSILSKFASKLNQLVRQVSDPNIDIMISVLRLRLERQEIQPLSDINNVNGCQEFALQSTLRLLEVNPKHPIGPDFVRLLLSGLQEHENDIFLLSVLDRWLPLIKSIFDEPQTAQFIRICTEQRHLGHSKLLEIQEFHHEIQTSVISLMTSTSNLSVVCQIPVEYYHRAVRKKMVQLLISRDDDIGSIDILLTKFARSGIFAKEVTIERLQTLSARWSKELLALYIESLDINTITEQLPALPTNLEHTYDVYILLIKRAQALQQGCESLQSKITRLKRAMLRWSVAASASRETTIAALDILVELSKLDEKEVELSDTTLDMSNEFFTSEQASTDLSMQSSQEDKFLAHICELCRHQDQDTQMLACSFLALQSTSAARTHGNLKSIESARTDQALYESITKVLPHSEQRIFACEYCGTTPSSQYYSLLLAFARQTGNSSFSFFNNCVESACEDIAQLRFEAMAERMSFMIQVIDRHSSVITTETVDSILTIIPVMLQSESENDLSTALGWTCSILRALSEHQTLRLQNRYHIIIGIFQVILAALFRVGQTTSHRASTETVTRCFSTFLNCMRQHSDSSERTNKALAKHVPWLLVEYISQTTSSRSNAVEASDKRLLEEHICYEIMSLCSTHEREMIGAALDSAKRAVFKRLYDEWNKFGRWIEK